MRTLKYREVTKIHKPRASIMQFAEDASNLCKNMFSNDEDPGEDLRVQILAKKSMEAINEVGPTPAMQSRKSIELKHAASQLISEDILVEQPSDSGPTSKEATPSQEATPSEELPHAPSKPTRAMYEKNSPGCVIIYNPHRTPDYESVLSHKRVGTSFRGLFNLFVVVLIAMNVRLVIENFVKYGFLLGAPFRAAAAMGWAAPVEFALSLIFMALFPTTACLIQRNAECLGETPTNLLTILNCLVMFTVPCVFIFVFDLPHIFGFAATILAIVYIMKIVSYAHVCSATRKLKRHAKKNDVDIVEELLGDKVVAAIVEQHPAGLTLHNMLKKNFLKKIFGYEARCEF